MRSLSVAGRLYLENVWRSTSESGVKNSVELRRSAHVKQASKRFEFESSRAERARTLFNSCTGNSGPLTMLQWTLGTFEGKTEII